MGRRERPASAVGPSPDSAAGAALAVHGQPEVCAVLEHAGARRWFARHPASSRRLNVEMTYDTAVTASRRVMKTLEEV